MATATTKAARAPPAIWAAPAVIGGEVGLPVWLPVWLPVLLPVWLPIWLPVWLPVALGFLPPELEAVPILTTVREGESQLVVGRGERVTMSLVEAGVLHSGHVTVVDTLWAMATAKQACQRELPEGCQVIEKRIAEPTYWPGRQQ